ncbi:pilus assembly protein [Kribbella sp. NBC_01245]|uniref:TadE family type IV pilus minor pilin n=1 Tax=Kribbella sp. NBC_01245 TaxID=2903578 RepID=UPI002E29C5CC|nr:TadE family type IV pilus minor pilin [Kribbella sp. NBC_01245]
MTAEVAIVLPVLVIAMFGALWLIGVLVANVRCGDAARDVARAVARGESESIARSLGERTAPRGAHITITRQGSDVVVTVQAEAQGEGAFLKLLPTTNLTARSVIHAEPGESP